MAATTSARPADQAIASLPARPPTPPREASNRATSAPIKPAVRQTLVRNQSLQTPPSIHTLISPATTESNLSSGRVRKKVEWSNHTEYKDAPQHQEGDRLAKSSPIAAAAAPRPIKGILKASSSPCQPSSALNTRLGSLDDQTSISDMLDSTIKQLSGADRDSKVDAYMTLARALKSSNNLPDRVALQGKLSLLTQFIQRDITLKTDTDPFDRSLVNHALSLLITFLHFNAIASTIPSDFAVFITDHAIRSFEDAKTPKETVRYLMQVMAFQSFTPKVMSQDRVGRLVSATHQLEGHWSGKSIVMSRIQLYKNLVKQCPQHIVMQTSWLPDLFTDMLSLTKDIRTEAISLGMEAGFQLRHEKQVLRHAMEILQSETEDKSFVQYYIERLQEMLKDRERSASVPQIWAVVNLFMRCPLERWDLYGPWLTVVQTAFNTADSATKLEANSAWNRYVYLCLSDSKLASKSLTTLCQPLLSQLRRKVSQKHPEETNKLRRAAIGGACNMFYYAFRPGNDKHSPDMIWDIAVQPILSQLITTENNPNAPADWVNLAARLLNSLLDGATPRVWREDRIQDAVPVRPDELPPLEPKWIRRHSDKVFTVLDAILEQKVLDLADPQSVAHRLWQSIVGAVATASAKDIKVSEDTVKFFANSFGLLYKIWTKGPPLDQTGASSYLLKGVSHMIRIMINGLGVLPFMEKKLAMATPNSFEPVATPSVRQERADKGHGVVRSPLLHLLNLFCTIPEGVADDEELSNLILSTFEPFFAGKSEKACLEQTRELLRSLPRNVVCPSGIWLLAAQNLKLPFSKPLKEGDRGDKILGPEYREMISFLERGLTCHPMLPPDRWLSLLDTVDKHVLHHFGQSGRVLVIIEPMAKILLDVMESEQTHITQQGFTITTAKLLSEAQFPSNKQAMDAARRHLWGAAPAASQHDAFKPFDNLYRLVTLATKKAYDSLDTPESNTAAVTLLDAVTNFISTSNDQAGSALAALGDALQLWIADESAQISLDDKSQTGQALIRLWSEICKVLVAVGKPQKGCLGPLEPLMSAGCKSKHVPVLTMAADTWNNMVDTVEEPECSDSLKSILSSLNSKLDVDMLGAELTSNQSGAQLHTPSDRQGSLDLLKPSANASSSLSQRPAAGITPSPPKVLSAMEAKREYRPEVTPRRTRSRAKKNTSTPRLRHDNSQIEFTAIASSSPVPDDSQHLTERQKEVRERQKGNAGVQPEQHPAESQEVDVKQLQQPISESTVAVEVRQREKTTPEPRASYEELISSTPTPRRGQVLQMDDLNDPPSSPPELRPYPLLPEIRTRSKTSSSLEQWEFSSPPGSPVLQANDPTSTSTGPQASQEPVLLQSTEQEQSPVHSEANESGGVEVALPAATQMDVESRPRRHKRRTSRSQTHESQSSVTRTASKRNLRSQVQEVSVSVKPEDQVETSITVAEVEERAPAQAIEMSDTGCASRKRRKSSSPTSTSIAIETVDADRPRSPEEVTADNTSDPKGKRKNEEAKQEEGRRKRRKSSRHRQAASPTGEDVASLAVGKMRTRRAKRKQQEQEDVEQDDAGTREADQMPIEPVPELVASTKVVDDEGDTDEELLSQLMADSQAASQSQSQSRSARASPIEDITLEKTPTKPVTEQQSRETAQQPSSVEEPAPAVEEDAATSVLSMLQNSRNLLQTASIDRMQVDQIEMMIMDLKRELYQAEFRGRKP